MKPKRKMYGQEEYELDNYLNDEDMERYSDEAGNSSIWYS